MRFSKELEKSCKLIKNVKTWISPVLLIYNANKELPALWRQRATDLYNILAIEIQFEFEFIMANKSVLNQKVMSEI